VKITITYDNEAAVEEMETGWGFSCMMEAHGRRILFDVGPDAAALLANMEGLGLDPKLIDEVFISHAHQDHMGALADFLRAYPVDCYLPTSCKPPRGAPGLIEVTDPLRMHEGIFSTGELGGVEQSLLVETAKGLAVIVGCSHPGVGAILEAAFRHGVPRALVGGLHGFRDFDLLDDLELVCPTHCTQHKSEIENLYPAKCVQGGVGAVIEIR